jgi:hypothetical protein
MKRITPSTLIATLALFVALTGTGVAASQALAPPNSVGTQQVVNGSIRLVDLHPTARNGMKGEPGPVGPVGPTGPSGLTGATGPTGPAGGFDPAKVQIVEGPAQDVAPSQVVTLRADCPAGMVAVGGGYYSSIATTGALLPGSASYAVIVSTYGVPITATGLRAYAVCAAR